MQNYTLADRYLYERYQREYPKPESEKAALRQVVKALNPDVVLLQEIGGDAFLRELVADLENQESIIYPFHASLSSEDAERKLGLISKVPFEWVANELNGKATFPYFGERVSLKRGLLEIKVSVGGRELTLMEMHLKSRITTVEKDPGGGIRREKEARLIRDYIRDLLEQHPEKAIVLMGDLNDHPRSRSYRRITYISDRPLLHELPVWDENDEVWTYFYRSQRRYEQIDYVFVSETLLDTQNWQIEAGIAGGEQVRLASDHRPIFLKVKICP